MDIEAYNHIRSGGMGFYQQSRGLIAVWGKEAVQFLDGMITNDMKTLEDGQQMLAAFPNAQGRLLAVVRVLRQDDRFLIETEEATREKVFNTLFRFTYAGDFFVEEITQQFEFWTLFGIDKSNYKEAQPQNGHAGSISYKGERFDVLPALRGESVQMVIPATQIVEDFVEDLSNETGAIRVDDDLYETLRIESGIPKYGVDMGENTIVPELGLDGLISYNKGCYIGQEIIARIHFRGHVAKQLTGLVLLEPEAVGTGFLPGAELTSMDGKNAGRITSVTYSPKLEKTIGLGFVRYDYLAHGTELSIGEARVSVNNTPS